MEEDTVSDMCRWIFMGFKKEKNIIPRFMRAARLGGVPDLGSPCWSCQDGQVRTLMMMLMEEKEAVLLTSGFSWPELARRVVETE